jgi:hypothetical protein
MRFSRIQKRRRKIMEENMTAPAENAAPASNAKQIDPERLLKLAKGTLDLITPIRAESHDLTALEYDFTKITGWEYADAMDKGKSESSFRLSAKQALSLFATAVTKATKGVDFTDILQRIGTADAIKAVQLATVFFVACTLEGNRRISNA